MTPTQSITQTWSAHHAWLDGPTPTAAARSRSASASSTARIQSAATTCPIRTTT